MKTTMPTPGLLKNTMRHGDKIKDIILEVHFDVGGESPHRIAYTKAHVTLEALSDPAYVRRCIDEGIERFIQQHVKKPKLS